MFKEAWPSSDKLERLRQEGETPYSQESLRFLCVAVLLFYYYQEFPEILKLLKMLAEIKVRSDLFNSLKIFTQLNSLLIIYPALCLSLMIILITLIKRRFVVRFSALTPDLSRFSPWSNFKKLSVFAKLSNALILFSASAILFGPLAYSYADILIKSPDLEIVKSTLKSFIVIITLLFVLISIVSFLFVLGGFFLRHRMSREELRQEGSGRSRDFVERL